MLETIVKTREGIPRIIKNMILSRSLKESKYIDGTLLEVIGKYMNGNEVKIFGFDNKDRAHIFRTKSLSNISAQVQLIEETLNLRQWPIHYQEFAGNYSTVHYFDVTYRMNEHKLLLRAKIEEKKI